MKKIFIILSLLIGSSFVSAAQNPCDHSVYQKGLRDYKSLNIDEFDMFLEFEEACMKHLDWNVDDIGLRIYAYRFSYNRHKNSIGRIQGNSSYLELLSFKLQSN